LLGENLPWVGEKVFLQMMTLSPKMRCLDDEICKTTFTNSPLLDFLELAGTADYIGELNYWYPTTKKPTASK
jgi:hypothetical protein